MYHHFYHHYHTKGDLKKQAELLVSTGIVIFFHFYFCFFGIKKVKVIFFEGGTGEYIYRSQKRH